MKKKLTILLDEDLIKQIKARAALNGLSLGDLIEEMYYSQYPDTHIQAVKNK